MSSSSARAAASSSDSVSTLPEVYASMARRASSPAETPSRRLISRSFFTLLRGTRYCWRSRSSAFADIGLLHPSRVPRTTIVRTPAHTQPDTQDSERLDRPAARAASKHPPVHARGFRIERQWVPCGGGPGAQRSPRLGLTLNRLPLVDLRSTPHL